MLVKQKLKQSNNENINMLIEYLVEESKKDEQLKNGIMQENKTIIKAWEYCNYKAREYLENKSGGIKDSVVVGWAIHYFTENDKVIEEEMGRVINDPVKMPEKSKQTEPKKLTNKSGVTFTQLELDLFGDV